MDYEDEEEQLEEQKQRNEQASIMEDMEQKQSFLNKLKSTAKNPITPLGNKGKKVANKTVDMIAKAWNKIPLKAKLIAIGVLFGLLLGVFVVIGFKSVIASVIEKINTSIENFLFLEENDIPEEQKAMYKTKGSLIKIKLNDIGKLYDSYMGTFADKESTVYKIYSKYLGSNQVLLNKIPNDNEIRPLYKHILLTEKYNFNSIKWIQYGHGIAGEPSPMSDDTDIGLTFPKDDNVTNVDTFIDLTLPYLQNWYIPFAMSTTYLNKANVANKSPTFPYSVLKYCKSDVTVNRYDMMRCEKITTYREDENGKTVVGIKKNETTNSQYYINKAYTFDTYIRNDYDYIPYTAEQVKNDQNPDSEQLLYRIPVYDKNGEVQYYLSEVERIWSDKLNQSNTEKRPYNYDDLIDYNKRIAGEEKQIVKEDLEKDSNTNVLYKAMAEDGELNLIDFMNANPNLYKEYLEEEEEVTKYLGYSRSFLVFAYDEIKTNFKSLVVKNNSLPFIYGKSLGFENLYTGESGSNGGSLVPGGGTGIFTFPIPSYIGEKKFSSMISSPFGPRIRSGKREFHRGIDIKSVKPLPNICAARGGKVVKAQYNSSYGNYVTIEHDNGYKTLYAHMQNGSLAVKVGDIVNTGDKLGVMGTTGDSSGNHLHFEIQDWTSGKEVLKNPKDFFNEDLSPVGGGGGSVITGPTPSITDAQKNELLSNLRKNSTNWADRGIWTVEYYKDNPVELAARMITHENGLTDAMVNDAGAIEMVRFKTSVMKNRGRDKGSVYNALLAPGQFHAVNASSFNKAPPQWVRELVAGVYNGTAPKSKIWTDFNLEDKPGSGISWISIYDKYGTWSNYTQIAAIKISTNGAVHGIALTNASSGGLSKTSNIMVKNGNNYKLRSDLPLYPGYSSNVYGFGRANYKGW